MPEAFIVDAVRTPVGRRGGGLSQSIRPTSARTPSPRSSSAPASTRTPSTTSCSATSTRSVPQAGCIARTCWLAAGLPQHVPGVTIDRQCGSAQQAVHFAAQAVMSGTMDLVVAGGVQNMSHDPDRVGDRRRRGARLRRPVHAVRPAGSTRYGNGEVSQFVGAEMMAEKWDITREEMEAFAVESHERALRARAEGRFEAEIAPLERPRPRRGTARAELGQDPLAADAHRGRSDHGGVSPARSPTARRRC